MDLGLVLLVFCGVLLSGGLWFGGCWFGLTWWVSCVFWRLMIWISGVLVAFLLLNVFLVLCFSDFVTWVGFSVLDGVF